MKTTFCTLALSFLLLGGCATTSTVEVNVGETSMDVYSATLKALVRNGFQITHTDRASHIMVASRPVRQAITNREDSEQVRVSVLVDQSLHGSVLIVTWTPPEGAMGSFRQEQDELLRRLSEGLPGVAVK